MTRARLALALAACLLLAVGGVPATRDDGPAGAPREARSAPAGA